MVLMGRIAVIISYSSRCLSLETIKYIHENSFIENLAASKQATTECGTERQTNLIINNECRFCMFRLFFFLFFTIDKTISTRHHIVDDSQR